MLVKWNSLALALVACSLASVRASAASATQRECSAAYQQAQVSMKRAKLQAAREALQRCMADKCSAILRQPCLEWLGEVDARQPTVVVSLRDTAGKQRTDAKLLIDDQVVSEDLSGTAVRVDPGLHRFRLEPVAADAIEEERLVVEGEKLVALAFSLAVRSPRLVTPTSLPSSSKAVQPQLVAVSARPVPGSAIVSAGASALALGAFGAFALWGKAGERQLEACRGSCTDASIDGVRSRYVAADISLAVAIGTAALAVVLFLTRPAVEVDGEVSQ